MATTDTTPEAPMTNADLAAKFAAGEITAAEMAAGFEANARTGWEAHNEATGCGGVTINTLGR